MKENKKVILEQGSSDEYKRIILEQGEEFDKESTTPQWNSMIDNTKETTAHYTTIFVKSFFDGIVPAFFMIIGFLVLLKLCC